MKLPDTNPIKFKSTTTKHVNYSFKFLFVIILLNILIEIIHLIFIDVDRTFINLIYRTHQFSFYINAIVYLFWYDKINANYSVVFKNENQSNIGGSLLWWFIPVVNIILPYNRLKAISTDFSKGEIKDEKLKNGIFLKIWAASFICWYLINIITIYNLPWFPEDIDMYYAMNPQREFFDNNSLNLLELVGLYSMYRIINNIQLSEQKFFREDDFNLLDHLVD